MFFAMKKLAAYCLARNTKKQTNGGKVKIMEKQWVKWVECTEKEKDELIGVLRRKLAEKKILVEILKRANAEKDQTINDQVSELVFAHKRIMNRESVIEKVRELVSDETA